MTDIFNGEFYLNIFLHITLLFTFLNLFFRLYISQLEKSAINNSVISLVNNNMNSNSVILPPSIKANIPYYKKLFSNSSENPIIINNNLLNKLTEFNIFLYIILIFFIIFLFITDNISVYEFFYVIGENIITFIGVGIVEYLFFTNIAFKYEPILPSVTYKLLLENLKTNFN